MLLLMPLFQCGSDWVAEQRAAMAAAEAAAAAGGELPEDDGEEDLVGPQLPEAAPGDRGNWGGALRPGAVSAKLCPDAAAGLECGSHDGGCVHDCILR